MRTRIATLCLLVPWLVAAGPLQEDLTLTDAVSSVATSPDRTLEQSVTATDPTVRGAALRWMVRTVSADKLVRWVGQGTYDPDPWVQRQVASALWERVDEPAALNLLRKYVLRTSADPYVRADFAHRLLDRDLGGDLSKLLGSWAHKPSWRAAPLALVGWRLGDAQALEVVRAALASAEFRDEPSFLRDLHFMRGEQEALLAVTRGRARADEYFGSRFDLAGGALGDDQATKGLKASFKQASPRSQWDLLSWIDDMRPPFRDDALAVAASAGGKVVKKAAAYVRQPTAAKAAKLLESGDADTQVFVLERASAVPDALLRQLLQSDVAQVRREALRAVARFGQADLADALKARMADDNPAVQVEAAGVLVLLGVD